MINTKTLEVVSLLRPIVQWNIKYSKNHLVSSSASLGRTCNRSNYITSMAQWGTWGQMEKARPFDCC